ncbi:MAG: GGDEF domain-containing protein [Lachnospiraceae bacterium]|nr:GGDEF domain-containing protein [Lachnospiraceae bacterium]
MSRARGINYNIIFSIIAFIGIIITIVASMNPYERDVHMIRNGAENFSSGWEYKNNRINSYDICNLPLSLDKNAYMDMTVRKLLGSECRDGMYIMYRSKHAENHVYVGKEEIYTYGDMQSSLFPLPGSAWILIPLKDSYEGEYLTIDLHRVEAKYGGIMEEAYIGDRGDMIEMLLVMNAVGIISVFFIAFMSFLLFFLGFVEAKMVHKYNIFFLAEFTAVVFIWSANETHCTQLFLGNMKMVSILTYEAIAFLPMPILSYYRSSRHKKVRDMCNKISLLPIANFLLMNIVHFAGIMDMSEMLILTHITILITCGCIIFAHIRSGIIGRNKNDSVFPELGSVGFIVLAISVFIDIGHYYTSNNIDASQYSRIGLLIFIFLLAVDTMHAALSDELDVRKAEVYKSLAFTDNLTGLGNRQAYEQELEKIDEREDLLEHLVVGILDLNNLKKLNDAKGHAEGDRYILSSSDFVQKYFSKIARVYRIGGDEFAVIFTGHDRDVFFETEANMFDDIMREGRHDINFAYGSAAYNYITDRNSSDTIKHAEAKMYESKRKYRHKAGEV